MFHKTIPECQIFPAFTMSAHALKESLDAARLIELCMAVTRAAFSVTIIALAEEVGIYDAHKQKHKPRHQQCDFNDS